jgi:CRISPR system Cascade subunit CasD
MSTLLLRLAGPLQAWGIDSKFEIRRTQRIPTKSGVVGLLATALGRKRDAPLEDLNALHFGVRVDQEGSVLRDFHVAKSETDSYTTHRDYLADAIFLVGLESEDERFLEELDQALRSPAFPLFLGRRSCPPTLPLTLGLRAQSLVEALTHEPWQKPAWRQRKGELLPLVTDVLPGESTTAVQRDVAISFGILRREYVWRGVVRREPVQVAPRLSETNHDAMEELT